MIRKIVGVNNPGLREKSKPAKKIDKKVLSLIKDLKDTLEAQTDPEGVGLAAPQIGKNLRVFVVKYQSKPEVFINPKILSTSVFIPKTASKKRKKIMEGCLSLPHYYGLLKRPQKVKIKYIAENGKQVTKTFEGFKAQIIQHEVDHLNGRLFVDKLIEQKKPLYELIGDQWQEVELV